MMMDTRSACLALALLMSGMNADGRFTAEEDKPMKDPQQYNHEAWQASSYGRSWQAEAERGCRPEESYPEPVPGVGTAHGPARADCGNSGLVAADPAKGR